jgi:metallo-beta-lactamase family protein
MAASLTFLGAARGVTGSCYHLDVDGEGLLIDCGTFQGDADADRRNRQPLDLDGASLHALVLTHGHLDHVGRSPLLARTGFRGRVLGHAATLDIARIILEDSAKIAKHDRRDEPPPYTEHHVEEIVAGMLPIRGGYNSPHRVGPFTITLFDAGHILGSSSVRVSFTEASGRSRAILFSGDLGVVGAPILADPFTAWDATRDAVDYVVTESTYGDRLHGPRSQVREQLQRVIERALRDGGKVLIPAFSIGRTQEILYELNTMIEAGQLGGIPVIIDGPLGLSATKIYARHTDCYDEEAIARLERGDHPLEFDSLHQAGDPRASRMAVGMDGPAIVIAGSGITSPATSPTRAPTSCSSATKPAAPSVATYRKAATRSISTASASPCAPRSRRSTASPPTPTATASPTGSPISRDATPAPSSSPTAKKRNRAPTPRSCSTTSALTPRCPRSISASSSESL